VNWTDAFVGIPFQDLGRDRKGCDCWGLACLVYAEELRIALPSYAGCYANTAEKEQTAALLSNRGKPWRAVTGPILPFDLLLFRVGGFDSHVGIAVDRHRMLHMAQGDQAKIESQKSSRWTHRYVASFRHEQIASRMPAEVLL